jgi:glutathione peroxidase
MDAKGRGDSMKKLAVLLFLIATAAAGQTKSGGKMPDVLSFTMDSIKGTPVNLAKYQGRVLLIVNTASQCGFTYQYEALENLHKKYTARGLSILGFPSNDFGQQEPGSNGEIEQFCKANYGVEFDMFSKVKVLGADKTALFKYLTSPQTSKFPGEIGWNFEKFLIGRDGRILARFKSEIEPDSAEVIQAVEKALGSEK